MVWADSLLCWGRQSGRGSLAAGSHLSPHILLEQEVDNVSGLLFLFFIRSRTVSCGMMPPMWGWVFLPQFSLSGNALTVRPRDVSPRGFQIQSSWQWLTMARLSLGPCTELICFLEEVLSPFKEASWVALIQVGSFNFVHSALVYVFIPTWGKDSVPQWEASWGQKVKGPCCESPETTCLYNPEQSETRSLGESYFNYYSSNKQYALQKKNVDTVPHTWPLSTSQVLFVRTTVV